MGKILRRRVRKMGSYGLTFNSSLAEVLSSLGNQSQEL